MSSYGLLALSVSAMALRHYPSLILAQLVVHSLLIATCASLLYGMAGLHPAHLPRAIFNYPPGDISRYQIQNPSLEQAVSGLGELPITVMEPPRMNNIRFTEPLKPWLPLISHMFFERAGPLSGTQYNRYYERYIARNCQPEGWLVTANDLHEFPHLQGFLSKHYTLEEARAHGGWRLYKYKRRIACKAK